jgi:predicted enzyme related to lactoylglutathione lyase
LGKPETMATETAEHHASLQGSTFVWHELYAADDQKAVDFYTQALDFGTQEMDMGPMGTYRMLTKNGQGVAGVMNTSKPPMDQMNIPPHWATYLAVDDVDARLAKCKELGATVVVEPMDIPGVGRMSLIQDPIGAHIWLFKPAPM